MMPNCQVSCYVLFGFHYIVCGTLTLQRKGTKADVETGKGDNTKAFDLFSSRIGKEEIFFHNCVQLELYNFPHTLLTLHLILHYRFIAFSGDTRLSKYSQSVQTVFVYAKLIFLTQFD